MSIEIQTRFGINHKNEYYNTMEEVIALPYYDKVYYIICRECNLIRLPDPLPISLRGLYCEDNHLTTLPELPPCLEELYCSNNLLTELPNLVIKDKDYPDFEYTKLKKTKM